MCGSGAFKRGLDRLLRRAKRGPIAIADARLSALAMAAAFDGHRRRLWLASAIHDASR
jgi:hypothetical protein